MIRFQQHFFDTNRRDCEHKLGLDQSRSSDDELYTAMAYADTPEEALAIMNVKMQVKDPEITDPPNPKSPISHLENLIEPIERHKKDLAGEQCRNLFRSIINLEDIDVSST